MGRKVIKQKLRIFGLNILFLYGEKKKEMQGKRSFAFLTFLVTFHNVKERERERNRTITSSP